MQVLRHDPVGTVRMFYSTSRGRSGLYHSCRKPLEVRLREAARVGGRDPGREAQQWALAPYRHFWAVVRQEAEAQGIPVPQAFLEVLAVDFSWDEPRPHPLLIPAG